MLADTAAHADDYVSRRLHALVDDILLPTVEGKVPESDALSVGQSRTPSIAFRTLVSALVYDILLPECEARSVGQSTTTDGWGHKHQLSWPTVLSVTQSLVKLRCGL